MAYTQESRSSRILDFDQIKVGDEAELTHTLTQADIDAFARLTGDFNPLHTDEEFARKTMFRKPVAHGMLTSSFISTLIGMLLPGQGALWTSQTLDFTYQAYVGDTLRVVARVKQKSIATRMLILDVLVTNQSGHKLVEGQSKVKLLNLEERRPGMSDHQKRTVLVTGGSGGIGAATAQKLASDGHAVVVNYMSNKQAAEQVVDLIVQSGGRSVAVQANIAKEDEVRSLFSTVEQTLGAIDAVVHCAAPNNAPRLFDDLTWEAFEEQIEIQVRGAFNCIKAALPGMIQLQSGVFVIVGSIYTDGTPPVQQARYVVAKAALVALVRSLAVEYGHKGIRANIVAPGMTQTDMIASLPDKVKMLTRMQTPLRRLAEPVDVANAIAFLVSESAKHITGQTIRVSGGINMA